MGIPPWGGHCLPMMKGPAPLRLEFTWSWKTTQSIPASPVYVACCLKTHVNKCLPAYMPPCTHIPPEAVGSKGRGPRGDVAHRKQVTNTARDRLRRLVAPRDSTALEQLLVFRFILPSRPSNVCPSEASSLHLVAALSGYQGAECAGWSPIHALPFAGVRDGVQRPSPPQPRARCRKARTS